MTLYQNNKGENLVVNPVFGVINKPQLTDVKTTTGLKFQIDTVEGKPVTATTSANVYFLPPSSTKFGYRDRITSMASQLGINNVGSYTLEANKASFQEGLNDFTVDITNFNFNYSYDYTNDPNLFTRSIIPTGQEAQNEAISVLKSVQRNPSEFESVKYKFNYFFFNSQQKTKVPVARNIDANIVEVNLFRGQLDEIPTVSNRYPNSNNYVTLATTGEGYLPIDIQIKFHERSMDQIGLYPLKTGDQAYDELKNGKGLILKNTDENNKNKVIKKMFVAYFEPDIYMEYLHPVYLFEGDDFAAIVWAVSDEYMSE